jgi:hypothetical protein
MLLLASWKVRVESWPHGLLTIVLQLAALVFFRLDGKGVHALLNRNRQQLDRAKIIAEPLKPDPN